MCQLLECDPQLNSVCSAAAAAVISVKPAALIPPPPPLLWINSSSDCVVPERPGRDESLLKQMRCYLSSGDGECPDASCCSPTGNWGASKTKEHLGLARSIALSRSLSLYALSAQSPFVFKAPTGGEQIYFQVRSRVEVTHYRIRSGNRSRLSPNIAARWRQDLHQCESLTLFILYSDPP